MQVIITAVGPDNRGLADPIVHYVTSAGANCFARDGSGWKTRAFFGDLGISEDPATGSAAGPLAVHLARHGKRGELYRIRRLKVQRYPRRPVHLPPAARLSLRAAKSVS